MDEQSYGTVVRPGPRHDAAGCREADHTAVVAAGVLYLEGAEWAATAGLALSQYSYEPLAISR